MMFQYWNPENFRLTHHEDFRILGNDFIQFIETNVHHILDIFIQEAFLQAIPKLADLAVRCILQEARILAQSSDQLEEYLKSFQVPNGNIIKIGENFQIQEKQRSAQLLLEMVENAIGTMNDWYNFLDQQVEVENFRDKVRDLRVKFQLQENQNCCLCQLI